MISGTTNSKPFINHFAAAANTREFWNRSFQFISHTGKVIEWGCSFSEKARPIGDKIGKTAKQVSYLKGLVKLSEIFDVARIPTQGEIKNSLDLGLHITKSAGLGISHLSQGAVLGHDAGFWKLGDAAAAVSNIGFGFGLTGLTSQSISQSIKSTVWRNEIYRAKQRHQYLETLIIGLEENETKKQNLLLEAVKNERNAISSWLLSAENELQKNNWLLLQTIGDVVSLFFNFIAQFAALIFTPIVACIEIASSIIGAIALWNSTEDSLPPVSSESPALETIYELEDSKDDSASKQLDPLQIFEDQNITMTYGTGVDFDELTGLDTLPTFDYLDPTNRLNPQ